MALQSPRKGESVGFTKYPNIKIAGTLGEPEKIIWSSIRHLAVKEVATGILMDVYGITNTNRLDKVTKNMRLYINHAYEYYVAAQQVKVNTAPLFYYYCFLNLAKALCEIQKPIFHRKNECYHHGLTWTPNREYLVNMEREYVNVTTRGVWHVLWETLTKNLSIIPNPTRIRIRDLFALCLNIQTEFEKTYERPSRVITLINPEALMSDDNREVWIRFAVNREELRDLGLSRPKLLELITNGTEYRQVESNMEGCWLFEFAEPKTVSPRFSGPAYNLVEPDLRRMNLFAYLSDDEIVYSIPIQSNFPIEIPQLLVLYTIVFWLGALVRYDPHSVADLQESKYWILIDGFINQSIIWLLELFEWEFYQTDSTLLTSR